MNKLIVLLLMLLVASCATNAISLRKSHSGTQQFTSPLPLTDVYEKIVERASNCNPGLVEDNMIMVVGVLPIPTTIKTEWFVKPTISIEKNSAEIQFFNKKGSTESHFMVTDLHLDANGLTVVKTYYKFSPWKDAAENVKGWVDGTPSSCWLK